MSSTSPEMPLRLEGVVDQFVAFEGSAPLAATIFVLDGMSRRFSLRLETSAYHDYMVTCEADEPREADSSDLEPVFLVPGKSINDTLIRRVLASEIVCDFLVEQTD